MTVLWSMLAALTFGTAVAFQQHEARFVATDRTLRAGLLVELGARPLWLFGLVLDIGGFVLQAVALGRGSIVLVQPLLTTNLVFALGISAALVRHRLRAAEWVAVAATVAGLVVFLEVAQPPGHAHGVASRTAWILCVGAVLGLVGACYALGARLVGTARAAVLAVAAACGEAMVAILTKVFVDRLGRGFASTFLSWEPWAVAAAGLCTLVLVQSAYQVGRPSVTLPVNAVAEPLVSCAIGVTLLGETLALGGVRSIVVALALAVMAAGLVSLARTPAVVGTEEAR